MSLTMISAVRARLARTLLAVLLLAVPATAPPALAQSMTDADAAAHVGTTPLRTDSPREVLMTFLALRDQMEGALVDYTTRSTLAGARRLALLSDQMVALFDLEELPSATRREVGIETATYLMDIFGRIDPPRQGDVPDQSALESEGSDAYRIAGTPLRIVRMTSGDREGEFLFSGATVQAAPRFLRGLMDIPLRSRLDIEL